MSVEKNHKLVEKLYDTLKTTWVDSFMSEIQKPEFETDASVTKKNQIALRVTENTRKEMERIANQRNMSLSDLANKVITWYVDYYKYCEEVDATNKRNWLTAFDSYIEEDQHNVIKMLVTSTIEGDDSIIKRALYEYPDEEFPKLRRMKEDKIQESGE